MLRRIVLSLLVLALLGGAGIRAQKGFQPEITTHELETHISFLASDSLKGRKPGTPEGKVAAEYIRNQFKDYGLT